MHGKHTHTHTQAQGTRHKTKQLAKDWKRIRLTLGPEIWFEGLLLFEVFEDFDQIVVLSYSVPENNT